MQPSRPNDGGNVVSVFIVFCAGINPLRLAMAILDLYHISPELPSKISPAFGFLCPAFVPTWPGYAQFGFLTAPASLRRLAFLRGGMMENHSAATAGFTRRR